MSVLHWRLCDKFFTFWFMEHRTKTTYHKGLNSIHVDITQEKKSVATQSQQWRSQKQSSFHTDSSGAGRVIDSTEIQQQLFTDKKELSVILEWNMASYFDRHSLFTS